MLHQELPVADVTPLEVEAFFDLGMTELDATAQESLAEVVSWIEANPGGSLTIEAWY